MYPRNAFNLAARNLRSLSLPTRRIHASIRVFADTPLAETVSTSKLDGDSQERWLFIDSVFPIRLGIWDLRHYIGILREESLLERLRERLETVKTHEFHVHELQPYLKDGGVFVRFTYTARDHQNALEMLQTDLQLEATKHGGLPSWSGLNYCNIWLVKGEPFLEDMYRYPSGIVHVSFQGPDVPEEALYSLFRPCGRIHNITAPTPVPAGTLRSSDIMFHRVRSATIARNTVHGYTFSDGGGTTRLRTVYQHPIQAHAIRDWLTSHPRIVLPILFFLLGTLTYTIFDPIRVLSVEGKMLNWFDHREYKLYKWLRAKALDRFSLTSFGREDVSPQGDIWKERKDAESAVRNYLSELPSTVAFVHGPQGSGKSSMLEAIIRDTGRKALVIDCAELNRATSDTRLVSALAQQTGYRPVFAFLNSVNNMVDIATVGLIGQKAGFTSSLEDQLKRILEVTGTALKKVNHSLRASAQRTVKAAQDAEARQAEEARTRARIRAGTWHDPRLDCVAGNGIISELGVGDELLDGADGEFTSFDAMEKDVGNSNGGGEKTSEELARQHRNAEDVQAVRTLPIVVIKNYAARGGAYKEELLSVLAHWAASLAENQIAHVIVVSDNRENAKLLARALPSKPLNSIALYDADAPTALSFVRRRLHDIGITSDLTSAQKKAIERLGGRTSDLERLIHKVSNGQGIEEAVEDIVVGGVGELRKKAFGEDIDDAKSLAWSREQAWIVLKQLARKAELPYYEVLLDAPFKGDELPLRAMEHAEIISISTQHGRPSTIRPGRPVFKNVFERLVNDPVFQATQDIALNDKLISSADSTVRTCESELSTLQDLVKAERSFWWFRRKATSERKDYLLKKMRSAQTKIQTLEKRNAELKRALVKAV
ncbi:RNA12 protein-domain-containing protein [Suillus clintonianus]|uniref:RNA12 protein-domain-containing protein n=1 Tax=Suillus clintonianus TaxID=1904413 RepID=UPI001B87BE55|nr:RNA12 protein-domain-containing protein [Suillus clintonianus]KAG2149305.1 RNA12 protein-domain-containing protein [Suillus clintonianus]